MAYATWNLNTVTGSTETDLVTGTASQTTLIKTMSICNQSGSDAAIVIKVTDTGNTAQATIVDATIADEETLFLDPNLFLDGTDKLRVESDQSATSFYASGDDNF